MNFDEFKQFFYGIDYEPGRLGIFNVNINNKGKKYEFVSLKTTGTFNEDICGFSLNHYGWMRLPMPTQKSSKFHDSEDVCIDIWRNEFISAEKINEKTVELKTKTFNATITW